MTPLLRKYTWIGFGKGTERQECIIEISHRYGEKLDCTRKAIILRISLDDYQVGDVNKMDKDLRADIGSGRNWEDSLL